MSEIRKGDTAPIIDNTALLREVQLQQGHAQSSFNWRDVASKDLEKRQRFFLDNESACSALAMEVLSLARHKMAASELQEFRQSLDTLQKRSLSAPEKGGALLQVHRLLTATSGAVGESERIQLAKLVLQNAAFPNRIDQGNHNTCNVTTLETRCYSRYPSIAAGVVADIALTGQFKTADGTMVKLESLEKDFESRLYRIDGGSRNYASQLFQMVAINAYWSRQDHMPNGKYAGRGNIVYAQESSRGNSTGEYILNKGVSPAQRFTLKNGGADGPQIDVEELVDINNQIVGKEEDDLILERNSSARKKGIVSIDSSADLRRVLTRLKAENKFPVVLVVDAAMPPFSSGSDQASRFARHGVTVTDYDSVNDKVTIDNQYGKANDHTGEPGQKARAGSEELYLAMRTRPPFGQVLDSMKKNLSNMEIKDFYRAASASGAMTAFYACAFTGSSRPRIIPIAEQRLERLIAADSSQVSRRAVEHRLDRLIQADRALAASATTAEQRLLGSAASLEGGTRTLAGQAATTVEQRILAGTTERSIFNGTARLSSRPTSILASGALNEVERRTLMASAGAGETRAASSLGWRLGSSLAAAALIVGVSDLRKAFSEGTEYGIGATGRVVMTSLGYEVGFALSAEVLERVGTKWLPAKVAIPVTVGLACATAYDTALGENFEKLIRSGYRQAREHFRSEPTTLVAGNGINKSLTAEARIDTPGRVFSMTQEKTPFLLERDHIRATLPTLPTPKHRELSLFAVSKSS